MMIHVSWHLPNGLLVNNQSYIMCDLVDVDSKSLREECQDKLWFKAFEVRTNQNNQLNTVEVVCETMCDKEVLDNSNEVNWRCLFIRCGQSEFSRTAYNSF